MSALAAWDVVTVPVAPGKRRSHLRLVPPPVPARPLRRAPLRLTGAGRLVLGLVVAVLAVLLFAGTVGAARGGTAPAVRTVTVQAGQTLSGIAAAQLPGLPISEGVVQLQLANGLNTPAIHAGQRLVIPELP